MSFHKAVIETFQFRLWFHTQWSWTPGYINVHEENIATTPSFSWPILFLNMVSWWNITLRRVFVKYSQIIYTRRVLQVLTMAMIDRRWSILNEWELLVSALVRDISSSSQRCWKLDLMTAVTTLYRSHSHDILIHDWHQTLQWRYNGHNGASNH